jgi:hypothetical protein
MWGGSSSAGRLQLGSQLLLRVVTAGCCCRAWRRRALGTMIGRAAAAPPLKLKGGAPAHVIGRLLNTIDVTRTTLQLVGRFGRLHQALCEGVHMSTWQCLDTHNMTACRCLMERVAAAVMHSMARGLHHHRQKTPTTTNIGGRHVAAPNQQPDPRLCTQQQHQTGDVNASHAALRCITNARQSAHSPEACGAGRWAHPATTALASAGGYLGT